MTQHSVVDSLSVEKKLTINDVQLSYIEQGQGDPVVFLHGIPTSNYLWRNVIPHLTDKARCIAPDLIGLGHSDQPDIDYTLYDHIYYIENFIHQLDLENVTLVMHAWGSVIGFDYAMRFPEKIKGLVFLEAHLRPVTDQNNLSLPMQERQRLIEGIHDAKAIVNKVLPAGAMRHLSAEEMQHYEEGCECPQRAKVIEQYLHDLPTGKNATPVVDVINQYSVKLQQSEIPKLMLYAVPGFNTSIETVMWAKDNLPNITVKEIDDALHYAQESHPDEVGQAIREWLSIISV